MKAISDPLGHIWAALPVPLQFGEQGRDIRDMRQSHTPPYCWDRKCRSFLLCNRPGGKWEDSPEGSLHKEMCEGDNAIWPPWQSHRARM